MEKIGILGIGKLGLCFALQLERAGYEVIGIDLSESYVQSLNEKTFSTLEPWVEEYLKDCKKFEASTEISDIVNDEVSTIFVFVATPSLPDGSYDHSQVERIVSQLLQFPKREKPVDLVIGCTVMPGYCNQLQDRLKDYNYKISYNPEFIAQGSIMTNLVNPDQVLIGEADEVSGDKIEAIYRKICTNQPKICRMDTLSAEITKLATNCFLTTKIAFANAIGDLAKKTGANTHKILQAIGADSRIGSKYLNYGYGYGGPCLPRDNRALGKFANENGMELLIGKATDEANKIHLLFQLQELLNKYQPNEPIVFETITYKPDSILLDESQQLALAVKLAENGRSVTIKERRAVINELNRIYPGHFNLIPID